MLLTDYFVSRPGRQWEFAKQCGVDHGVIRLPEDDAFDLTDASHWQDVYHRFTSHGITPVIIEPMPNAVHDHIKAGDALRDESIEKVLKMFPIMRSLGIDTICFNFMAYLGWFRTDKGIRERGDALVTGFDMQKFVPIDATITEAQLWENYTYFINAVLPDAERYGIKLALHPDDPPHAKLGGVSRIMVTYENIKRAIYGIKESPSLGVTMCQACYHLMGEDLEKVIPELSKKIFFVHFRNVRGDKFNFRETFHDNGEIDMAKMIRIYRDCGVDVPIRVDHVPVMAGETSETAGYDTLGRLFAIGYLKGLLEQAEAR